MKIVVDTNVLVSGLLNPSGPPGKIVTLLASGEISLYFDARIFLEYSEVFSRPKFCFVRERIATFLEQLESTGEIVSAKMLSKPLPHGSGEPFLEVAISANAKYLITGNDRHFPRESWERVEVLSPHDFLEIFRKTGGKG